MKMIVAMTTNVFLSLPRVISGNHRTTTENVSTSNSQPASGCRENTHSNRISSFMTLRPLTRFSSDPGRHISHFRHIFRSSPLAAVWVCALPLPGCRYHAGSPRKGKSTRTLSRRIREDPPAHIRLPYLRLYSTLGTLSGIFRSCPYLCTLHTLLLVDADNMTAL